MKAFARGISVLLAALLLFGGVPPAAATAGVIGVGSYRSPAFAVKAGNQYLLTVTTAASLNDVTDGNLLYIDIQQATTEDELNGYITFEGFYLRRSQQAYYYITGTDSNGLPVALREQSESGNGFSGGTISSAYGGSARVTPVDRFGYYHLSDAVWSGPADGSIPDMINLAAGYYVLRIDQPGYQPFFYPGSAPFTPPTGEYFTLTGGHTAALPAIDISANLGDANGDGRINPGDIAALVGRIASGANLSDPWFDLNLSGAADEADLELLLAAGKINSTRGALAQNPTLTAAAEAGANGVYELELTLAKEMKAAGLVMEYDCAVLDLCTPSGVVIDPSSALSSAVTAGADLVLYSAEWEESGSRATAALRLRGNGTAAADSSDALATVCFRLKDGKTEQHLWSDSIQISSAYAAIGSTALVRRDARSENTLHISLTYPNSTVERVEALTVGGSGTVTVPPHYTTPNQPEAVNQTPAQAVLSLDAFGSGGAAVSAPSGVVWSMTGAGAGVTLADGTLTIAPGAEAGTVEVTAAYRSVISDPFRVTVTRQPSTETLVAVMLDGAPAGPAETVCIVAGGCTASFAAEVINQYGEEMGGDLTWSVTGTLPAGVTHADGVLTLSAGAEEGSFVLTAASAENPAIATDIAVTIASQTLAALTVSGGAAVTVPPCYALNNETPLTARTSITLTAAAEDIQSRSMPLPTDVVWSVETPRTGVALSGAQGAETAELTVTPGAPASTVTVQAESGSVVGKLDVAVQRAESVPTLLQVWKGGTRIGASDAITATTQYDVKVLDQYGAEMEAVVVRWSGVSPGAGPTGRPATITVGPDTVPGTYPVTAAAGEATHTFSLTITPPAGGGNPGGGNPGGGNPGGGNPGGLIPPAEDADVPYTPPTAPSVTVSPSATVTGSGSYQVTMTAQEAFLMLSGRSGSGHMAVVPQMEQTADQVTLTLSAGTLTALHGAGSTNPLRLTAPFGSVQVASALLSGSGELSITLARTGQDGYTISVTRGGAPIGQVPGGLTALIPATPSGSVTAIYTDASGEEQIISKAAFVGGVLVVPLEGTGSFRIERRTQSFADLAGIDHWAEDSIDFAASRGLVNGVGDGSEFAPAMSMTRGMLMTVLHRLEGLPAPKSRPAFTDVPAGGWYAEATAWAGSWDIISAATGTAQPEADITREQIADMLYRYAAALGVNTAPHKSLGGFPDSAQASADTETALRWAAAVGLINGKSDGRLDPQGGATRAEVVTLLERFVAFLAGEQLGGKMK